jgi:hypothetical protein
MKLLRDIDKLALTTLLLGALAIGLSVSVLAAGGNALVWTAPTTREDGSAYNMAADTGSKYVVTHTKGTATGTFNVAGTLLTADITSYAPGTTFTIKACDSANVCSADSESVKKTGAPSRPGGVAIR